MLLGIFAKLSGIFALMLLIVALLGKLLAAAGILLVAIKIAIVVISVILLLGVTVALHHVDPAQKTPEPEQPPVEQAPVQPEDRNGLYVFRLARPLPPGGKLRLGFQYEGRLLPARGFEQQPLAGVITVDVGAVVPIPTLPVLPCSRIISGAAGSPPTAASAPWCSRAPAAASRRGWTSNRKLW